MKRKKQDYYFTVNALATKSERENAKRLGAKLVNGLYGETFKKPVGKVYGNVPEHLNDNKAPVRKKAKSPEIVSEKKPEVE